MRSRILAVAVLLICSAVTAHAGGPGVCSGFRLQRRSRGPSPGLGEWLCAVLHRPGRPEPDPAGAEADAFVATAFSAWTNLSGVALTDLRVDILPRT